MNLDRDLRDALRPLAGDAIADAQRVLAALPEAPPVPVPDGAVPPGLPKWFWWANAAALAAGIALGFLFARGAQGTTEQDVAGPGGDRGTVAQPEGPRQPEDDPEQKTEEQKKKEQSKQPDPMWSEDPHLVVMPFGPVAVDEPNHPRQDLQPTAYLVELGALVETFESTAGIYVYPTDARVRLAWHAVATVDEARVDLRNGMVWLSTINRPVTMQIDAGHAMVELDAAELLVERRPTSTTVTALAGEVTVRVGATPPGTGQTRTLEANQRLTVDFDGAIGEVETVPFAAAETSWMLPMILQQQDDAELKQRIQDMAAAFAEGAHRDAAAIELRKLGSRTVPVLHGIYEQAAEDPVLARRAAELIGNTAEYLYKDWLFTLLEHGDEHVRAAMFHALVRVGSFTIEDETFWRAGSVEERATALARWCALLR